MNRQDFLKEMRKGLFSTIRTVYEPFVDEELEKLEKTADSMLGIRWVFVCQKDTEFTKVNEYFIHGKPIYIIQMNGNMRAMSGICPSCSNLLNLSNLLLTCKCLNCEKDYNFQTNIGNLDITELPLIEKSDGYYVGL
ncbi:hypothetical protein [Bacillus marasmi]|uniref:hypothetical protein n=1 Tax=Bacillus marasmi TaxID=1926279 RepID=UPI0011C72AEF|nr:hypothetical protein [Bacillus marasmi]